MTRSPRQAELQRRSWRQPTSYMSAPNGAGSHNRSAPHSGSTRLRRQPEALSAMGGHDAELGAQHSISGVSHLCHCGWIAPAVASRMPAGGIWGIPSR